MRGLFVTGTDTGVGKTALTTRILRQAAQEGWRCGGYKPVCSGADRGPDGTWHWDDLEAIENCLPEGWRPLVRGQVFLAPRAPNVAARLEGRIVDTSALIDGAARWSPHVDGLVVEGAGGWYCPVSDDQLIADLARELGFPVLVVSRPGLGTISHTLLTVESIRASGLEVAGVVVNDARGELAWPDDLLVSNLEQIETWSRVPVLGFVPHGSEAVLRAGEPTRIYWASLMRPPIAGSALSHRLATPATHS